MKPYSALFSNSLDIIIALILVTLWLVVFTFILHGYDQERYGENAGYCWPVTRAFLYLCAAIATVFAVGLVFLAWLRIASSFWMIWQLLWLISVVCVFRVLPFLGIVPIGWAWLENWRGRMNKNKTIFITVACPLAVV